MLLRGVSEMGPTHQRGGTFSLSTHCSLFQAFALFCVHTLRWNPFPPQEKMCDSHCCKVELRPELVTFEGSWAEPWKNSLYKYILGIQYIHVYIYIYIYIFVFRQSHSERVIPKKMDLELGYPSNTWWNSGMYLGSLFSVAFGRVASQSGTFGKNILLTSKLKICKWMFEALCHHAKHGFGNLGGCLSDPTQIARSSYLQKLSFSKCDHGLPL